MIRISAALFACAVVFAAPPAHSTFQITSLSNRPNMISGGDVLLRVDVPENLPLAQATVKLNGADVTASFKSDAAEHALVGLVKGLKNGDNRVDVSRRQITRRASGTDESSRSPDPFSPVHKSSRSSAPPINSSFLTATR